MKILVTGANGFVGKNLIIHLNEMDNIEVVPFTRNNEISELPKLLSDADAVLHLAGVNRPRNEAEFTQGNADLTQTLVDVVEHITVTEKRQIPIAFSSSIQAERDNAYGKSKFAAEQALLGLKARTGTPVYIFRLNNVFGKWCRPNYNSMVATFCHNIIRDLPIQIHDETAEVSLVYIDDVVRAMLEPLLTAVDAWAQKGELPESGYRQASPVYTRRVGEVAEQLRQFKDSRETLISERVGTGFTRKLYSTYISYLPTEQFTYTVPSHGDERGVFVEMLKTPDAGQFSYFTAHPGITRGGHYHHTKTEKFLVIKGKARFSFRHMVTDEYYELYTHGETPEIVETVPGWSHDITNVGDDEMVVMLWANEIFDREHPDTYACPISRPAERLAQ